MAITVPALDEATTYSDTDLILITHSDGTSEKITGANFNARIDAAIAARFVTGNPLFRAINALESHRQVRYVNGVLGKDITSYYTDGSLWKRLTGTDGYDFLEDIYVGDKFQMSRAITAPNQASQYATTGSDWVTIADIDAYYNTGDSGNGLNYHHLVMVPGKGEEGNQHFGRKRMNATNTAENGYTGSEMHTATLGNTTDAASTETGATINQQLKAEFGSHVKTIRCNITTAITSTLYNRFGSATGASSARAWSDAIAVLMSEVEVYGSTIWSSSGYDTGEACKPLALFQQSKRAMANRTSYWWLRDVASSAYFACVDTNGRANYYAASSTNFSVRPRFVLGA